MRKNLYDPYKTSDFFTDTIKNIYNDIEQSRPAYPSNGFSSNAVLKHRETSNHGYRKYNDTVQQRNVYTSDKSVESKPFRLATGLPDKPHILNIPINNSSNALPASPEKKYGIKTLLHSKNKAVYPFNKTLTKEYSISDETVHNIEVSKQTIQNICDSERDSTKTEDITPPIFVERDIVLPMTDDKRLVYEDIEDVNNNVNDDVNDVNDDVNDDIVSNNLIIESNQNDSLNYNLQQNSFNSDRNDIKKQDPIIGNMDNLENEKLAVNETDQSSDNGVDEQHIMQTQPLVELVDHSPRVIIKKQIEIPKDDDSSDNTNETNLQSQLLMSRRNMESLMVTQSTLSSLNTDWPELCIDDINTSLKVIGDLPPNRKLRIVNNTHISEEASYVPSLTRYGAGQSRDKIFSFLEHMFAELERNVVLILGEIRTGVNVDNNVCKIRGLICKLAVFLHKYENMRSVYKSDSSMYAQLGNNRDKFHVFMDNFFRDVTIPSK